MKTSMTILGCMAHFYEQPEFRDEVRKSGKEDEVQQLEMKLSEILMPIAIKVVLDKKQNEAKGWV